MSIWISLLLAFLPKILEWILSLIRDNKQLTGRQLDKVNHVVWYTHQISEAAPKVGCAAGGVKPPVEGADPEADLVGGLLDGWLETMLLRYLREHGPEVALRLLKDVLLPLAKARAAATPNKWDDYGVKLLETTINDPEFIALLEGIS